MYRRMLVPLDGSELSEIVFPYVRDLAVRLGIEVILFHVHGPSDGEAAALYRAYVDHKAATVKHQVTAAGENDIKIRGEMVNGYPAEEIVRYVTDNKVDLILLATHGRSGIRRWLMGSVADKVLKVAPVPVLLITATKKEGIAYDKWPRHKILVPLDGSKLAESVLPHAEALAREHNPEETELVLMRVCEMIDAFGYYPPSARFETAGGAVHVMPEELARQQKEMQHIIAKQYLAEVKTKLGATGLKVTTVIRDGNAADEIIDYARNNPFHLIVMATHARSGISRWAYGSVAHHVLEGTESPLLLVRTHQP